MNELLHFIDAHTPPCLLDMSQASLEESENNQFIATFHYHSIAAALDIVHKSYSPKFLYDVLLVLKKCHFSFFSQVFMSILYAVLLILL